MKEPILERHYLFYLQLHYRAAVLFPHLDGGALQQEDCLRFSRRPRPGCAPLQRYFRVILGCPVGIGTSLPGVPQSIRSQNQHRDAALLFHRV